MAYKIKRFFLLGMYSFTLEKTSLAFSEKNLFKRCYTHLTQMFPSKTNPYYTAVESGAQTAIEACQQLLDDSYFNDQNAIAAENEFTLAVVKNFHHLHSTFFKKINFTSLGSGNQNASLEQVLDRSSPATYYTLALFSPNIGADVVWTASDNFIPIRSLSGSVESVNGVANDRFIFDLTKLFFPDRGNFLGVRSISPLESLWPFNFVTGANAARSGEVDVYYHFGGGFMGHQVYVSQTVNEPLGIAADGGVFMPRKWANSIFTDSLCRSLPVVRAEDAESTVVATSSLPFRKTTGCNRCHVSMDQLAGTLRNISSNGYAGPQATPNRGGYYYGSFSVSEPAVPGWPAEPTENFHLTPPGGRLYFRDYKGELQDHPLTSVNNLGTVIATLEDPYICWASRYFQYFTGVKVPLMDPGNAQEAFSESHEQITYRNIVYDLGIAFKQHRDPKELIKNILNLSLYRTYNYQLPAEDLP